MLLGGCAVLHILEDDGIHRPPFAGKGGQRRQSPAAHRTNTFRIERRENQGGITWQGKFLQGTAKNRGKGATPPFSCRRGSGADVAFFAQHLRRQELEQIAREAGAELVNSRVVPAKGAAAAPRTWNNTTALTHIAGGARKRSARRFCRERRSTMALQRDRDGKRLHVKSKLMGESLVSKRFVESLPQAPQVRLFPDVHVLKVGGQSICDRGVKALPGIIREITANKAKHKMLLTTGGGTRSRHIYAIGLELGMPTGVIAKFGSSVSEQNALLVAMLLSPWEASRSATTRS
jgi:hypothetical protein